MGRGEVRTMTTRVHEPTQLTRRAWRWRPSSHSQETQRIGRRNAYMSIMHRLCNDYASIEHKDVGITWHNRCKEAKRQHPLQIPGPWATLQTAASVMEQG